MQTQRHDSKSVRVWHLMDAELCKVFWTHYTRLPMQQRARLVLDTLEVANREDKSLYLAARTMLGRVGVENLASYAALMAA